MGRRAEHARGRLRRLKLKLGARDGLDVERVRAVRPAAEVPLQVDVNEAWSLGEALDVLRSWCPRGICCSPRDSPTARTTADCVSDVASDFSSDDAPALTR